MQPIYRERKKMTRQEFDSFTVSVRNKLLALAWRYKASGGMDEDPEDIVQESLLTLWRLITEGYPIRDIEGRNARIALCSYHDLV